ncbi:MAG: glycoside hydrolase family 3 N-terminal domain-containing protein [Cyanobacteria bacterium P01_A01_bin.105]
MQPLLPDLDDLSLERLVAQLIVVRTTGHLFDHEIQYPQCEASRPELEHLVGELGVGGVILLGGSAAEVAVRSQFLQSLATVPLLLAADIEEGVGQRFSGATWFPPPLALGAIAPHDLPLALALAEQMGRTTAQEAVAIGLNWVLAPTVDVNNNPANPVINVRAFGEDPDTVSQLACAFMRGAQDFPVLTTAKHFPGHGDTATDSHLDLPVLPYDLDRLAALELAPFRQAIAAGVDSVMTAHLRLPSLDPQHPATLSSPMLSGLLRRDLGFGGLIVTDALMMGAITKQYGPYEAAVLAVEAGADVVLMPPDPVGAIAALCEAVHTERLSYLHIRTAAERIWQAKRKILGAIATATPHAWEQTEPRLQLDAIARPEAHHTVEKILTASLDTACLAQAGPSLPPVKNGCNLVLVDDVIACRPLPRTAPALTLPIPHGYPYQVVDSRWPVSQALGPAPRPTLLQLFIRGNPFRSSAGLIDLAQQYITALGDALKAVVIYGSPYVRPALNLPDGCPVIFCYGQMPAAQTVALKALFTPPSNEATVTAPTAIDASFTD